MHAQPTERGRAVRVCRNARIEVDAVAFREGYANLKRAGLNINQISKSLNTHGAQARLRPP